MAAAESAEGLLAMQCGSRNSFAKFQGLHSTYYSDLLFCCVFLLIMVKLQLNLAIPASIW